MSLQVCQNHALHMLLSKLAQHLVLAVKQATVPHMNDSAARFVESITNISDAYFLYVNHKSMPKSRNRCSHPSQVDRASLHVKWKD